MAGTSNLVRVIAAAVRRAERVSRYRAGLLRWTDLTLDERVAAYEASEAEVREEAARAVAS